MNERQRTVLDVSALPRHAFGPRELTWWSNIAFMIVEGTTLLICAVVYIYLRRNFESWPPLRTAPPGLLIPTISLIALAASTVFAQLEGRSARQTDLAGIRYWGMIGILASVVALALRAFEFTVLNTRWDHDAYGSIVWFTIGFHTTLLIFQFLEDAFFLAVAYKGPIEDKYFPHVSEKADYAKFVLAAWIPMYVLLFWGPRFL